MENLGGSLRSFRKKRGMTLDDLAKKTDLSVGFISKVERGINSPSFNNLQKICSALNITTNELIQPKDLPSGTMVIRRGERQLVYDYSGVIKYETISAFSDFSLDAMTLNGSSMEYSSTQHPYDELGIIATGRLLVIIGGQEQILEQGDAILIPAGETHHVQKMNEDICESFWIKIYHN